LGQIAHELHLPLKRVQRTVELLDEGNTVPFITRYRREQTGGFDEEQIRLIAEELKKRRQLLDRKNTILKNIEASGKLTPELRDDIVHAPNLKRLEDLYLPYKVKKQTLATQARERGLEPLALEILNGDVADLAARAAEFINAEKELPTTAEVLAGVQHIIAERFSERADVRGRLRRIFFRGGRLISTKIEKLPEAEPVAEATTTGDADVAPVSVEVPETTIAPNLAESAVESAPSDTTTGEVAVAEIATTAENVTEPIQVVVSADESADATGTVATDSATDTPVLEGELAAGRLFEKPATPVLAPVDKKKKKKKKKLTDAAFKDYFQFQEPLGKLPPHRTLAINRGERANVLRVKIESDVEAMQHEAEQVVIPPQHPHAEFLRGCVRDALTRLLVPSLEREARRELSEKAEQHAVEVFIRNLRKLLLQPPVHGRRVLAIDPGYKSGCKMAAVDEWGNVLGHGMFYVVGRDDRRDKARARIVDMVRKHNLSVIAIGNGTASRDTEQLVAEILANELQGQDVAYVTVNEAGASVYSTSPLGREELPTYDAILRSAVSIGRRLLDPLSELVKINPANIGVGMYQHDMKAKHLKDSLDAVVESCVNFVGVDVNSASPALLRYVSGLNALTARRIYEYRREHGPFITREALKQVPGVGEASFVQSAGFLKILGGDNPLDATWIHPESYAIAQRLLERFGSSVEEFKQAVPTPVAPPVNVEAPKFGEGLIDSSDEALSQAEQGGIQTEEAIVTAALNETPADDVIAEHMPATAAATQPPVESEPTPIAVDDAIEQAEQGGIQTEEAIVTAALNETTSDDVIAEHMPQGLVSHESSSEPATPLAPKPNPIAEKLAQIDIPAVAAEMGVSPILLEDIVKSLTRPGRDPREELPPPMFRRGIMKLDDLTPGMELQGTVLNVVDFGAFVDIGLSDSGLVHISRLADRYIRDPHEVVGVGDILKLWVVEVDRNRRRVSLTAIPPGSERPQRPRREEGQPQRERQPRPPRGEQGNSGQAHGGQDRAGQNRPDQYRGGEARGGQNRGGGDRGQRGGQPRPAGAGQGAPRRDGPPPVTPPGDRPPRDQRDRRPRNDGPRDRMPRVTERPPTKPKVVKPISKAQEEGRAPLRSFSDLMQLMDKKKDKKE
jgi:uncharacterized protein